MGEVEWTVTFDFAKGTRPSFEAMRTKANNLTAYPPAITKGWTFLDLVGQTVLRAYQGITPEEREEEERPLTLENLKIGILEEITKLEDAWTDFSRQKRSDGSTKFWVAGENTEYLSCWVGNLMSLEILDVFGCSRFEMTSEYTTYEEIYPNPLPYTERPHVQLGFKEAAEQDAETAQLMKDNPSVWDFAAGAEEGDRVVAVCGDFFVPGEVHIFGHGTYVGDFIPPGQNSPNPKIRLDSGDIVWGMQCWWGPEEKFKEWVGKRTVYVNLQSAPIPPKDTKLDHAVWGDLFR